jgi:hypothetical protein
MAAKYWLARPVFGFCRNTREIVTIPAGAIVALYQTAQIVGAVQVRWKDRQLFAFREDVRENGIPFREPSDFALGV